MKNSSMQSLLHLTVFLFLALQVSAECTCDPETELGEDKNKALGYKIAAICSILIASAVGVSLPILGKKIPALSPESNVFFLVKSLAAGVILATGFIHILPDAFENLSSPCLGESPWGEFPFAGFIAMVSAIVTMMIDACATSYYTRSRLEKTKSAGGDEEKQAEHGGHLQVHTHGHGHGSALADDESKSLDLVRHRVITQVLELGIVVHSVIIGISMGASQSPETIKPLVAALTFHQLFEGMGLGGCISQANFGRWTIVSMGLYFCLTTPIGIAIGMGITNVYKESSPTALIVQGCLNSASAGILIYMALVDLIAADYMSPRMLANPRLQIGSSISLLLGSGCMSVLAKWA